MKERKWDSSSAQRRRGNGARGSEIARPRELGERLKGRERGRGEMGVIEKRRFTWASSGLGKRLLLLAATSLEVRSLYIYMYWVVVVGRTRSSSSSSPFFYCLSTAAGGFFAALARK